MKYPQEKIFDSRNSHKKKTWTYKINTRKNLDPKKTRWYDSMRPTRGTMARDPRNLPHSLKVGSSFFEYRKNTIYKEKH